MNMLELLPFLGHSSIHPPFDEFLTKNGLIKRPNIKRDLDTSISVPGQGLTLSFAFDVDAEKNGFKVKSEGTFVFKTLNVMLIAENKKDGKYLGDLPRNLQITDNRAAIETKLEEPKRRNADSDNYYLDELVWTVAFEKEKLHFIEFGLPTNGWRKHGICP